MNGHCAIHSSKYAKLVTVNKDRFIENIIRKYM